MPFAGNFHPEWGYLAPAPSFMRTIRIVVVATAVGATAGAGVVLTLAERTDPSAANGKVVVVRSLVQPAEAALPAGAPRAATAAPPATVTPAPTQATAHQPQGNQAQSAAALLGPAGIGQAQTSSLQPSPAPTSPARPEIAPPPSVTAASPATAVQSVNVPPRPVQAAGVAPPASALLPVSAPAASDSRTASTSESPTGIAALSESPASIESVAAPPIEALTPEPAAPAKSKRRRAAQPREPQGYGAPDRRRSANADRGGLGPLLQHLFSARGPSYYQN